MCGLTRAASGESRNHRRANCFIGLENHPTIGVRLLAYVGRRRALRSEEILSDLPSTPLLIDGRVLIDAAAGAILGIWRITRVDHPISDE